MLSWAWRMDTRSLLSLKGLAGGRGCHGGLDIQGAARGKGLLVVGVRVASVWNVHCVFFPRQRAGCGWGWERAGVSGTLPPGWDMEP